MVTKNAIMLVDFAVEQVAAGMGRIDAVIDAGRKRARPIVMTTLAMVAGMVPSSLAVEDGGSSRSPMAIAVMGGLLVSTVLSLVFVPSFYTVMDDIGRCSCKKSVPRSFEGATATLSTRIFSRPPSASWQPIWGASKSSCRIGRSFGSWHTADFTPTS